jgi:hypothetical protein
MKKYILYYHGNNFEEDVKKLGGLEGTYPAVNMAVINSEKTVEEINQILSPTWYAKEDTVSKLLKHNPDLQEI